MGIEYLDEKPSGKIEYLDESPMGAINKGLSYLDMSIPTSFSGLKANVKKSLAKTATPEGMMASAILPTTGGLKGLKGLLGKRAVQQELPKIAKMVDTAEILPTSLEKTNIQNVASNKFVRDNTANFLGKQAPEIAKTAADLTKQVKPAIRTAQNEFYSKLGIKDIDPLDISSAKELLKKELNEAPKYLNEADVKKARAIIGDLTGKQNVAQFGKVKEASRILYDLAEDNVNDMGRKTVTGKFFSKLGGILTDVKHSDPRIKMAGGQYKDLIEAEKLINKTLRLNREMGEMRLEGRIASSFKDKGQMTFKENLSKLDDILRRYPETKHLVDYGGFTDQIKLAQLANDLATKKAVTPQGLGRIPGMKYIANILKVGDPEFQAVILKRGIESGRINPEAVMGKTKLSEGLLGGKTFTRYRALKSILRKGE